MSTFQVESAGRSCGLGPGVVDPYQTTSTRPGSPAATHGKTVVGTPGGFTRIGVAHVPPWSRDHESMVSVRSPPRRSFHTEYRFPARSIASDTNESNVS